MSVRLLFRYGGFFEHNLNDGRIYYKGGNLKATMYSGDNSLGQLKAHLGARICCDPSNLSIMYQEKELPNTDLVELSDDGDVKCMLMVASEVYLCVANQPLEPIVAEHQPTEVGVAPSTKSSCPNEPVTVPVTNNEVQEYESKSEHELQIQRDGDNLEPSGSRHTSKRMQVGLCVGQDFDTVKELRDYLVDYAIHENFIVKYLRNDQERVIAFCAGEGCSWRVRCSKVGSTKIFRVREMINEHTCGRLMGTAHQPLARSQWVAKKIKARLNDQMDLTPKDIANVVQNDHGVPLSYMQAWRGIEAARAMILGSEAQSYRPKKQRKPTKVKDARAYYCKHCGALGHNKRTCKEPIHNMMPETSAQASGPASSVRTST